MKLSENIAQFCYVNENYSVFYDEKFVNDYNFKNLSIKLKFLLCGPPQSKEEGIYYRIIKSHEKKEICIQNIIFYKKQKFPYHIHDFHPFYIYLDFQKNVKYVVIDDGHHFSKKLGPFRDLQNKDLIITIFLPDHGLTNKLGSFGRLFKPRFIPLKPETIFKWWTYNSMAQIKLRTKLIDPWSAGLIPRRFASSDTILSRINYIIPLNIIPENKMNKIYSFRDKSSCPICGDVFLLDFMEVKMDKFTGNLFLQKKHRCKNGHPYLIKYDFKEGKIYNHSL